MEIITKGHEAKNAVMQIMQLFFSLDDNVRVESELKTENGASVSKAKVFYKNEEFYGEAKTEKSEPIYITNAIKKATFYAAGKIGEMPAPWGISTGIRPAKTARKMIEKGLNDDKIFSHLKDEYLMSEDKARLALSVAHKELGILKSMPENSVSIYVGIPFCPSRCSYCSFISQATEHNNKFIEPYVNALLDEIRYSAKIIKELNKTVDTIYFGGGTPTAIKPNLLEKIIGAIEDNFDLSDLREFTVEAGRPDTFSKEMMCMLKRHSVGRISINPQTMHQKTLDTIGRKHSVDDVKRAFYMAHEAGIESINADLIAALPGEDKHMMEYTVNELLKLEPDAVTVHTLYMKRASKLIDEFSRLRFTKNAAEIMDAAKAILGENGILPYYMYKQRNTLGNLENVGFALKGHESLYNVYIMEEVQPIIALGAGGSTKMVRGEEIERVYNPKEASDYTNRIDEVLKRKDAFLNFYKGEKNDGIY